MRFAHTHVCPVLRNFDAMAPRTAESISASSKTMNGALPPSSREIFFTVAAHCSINFLPISVEPVNDNLRTIGFDVISPPISRAEPVTTLIIPAGIPACSASSAKANAEYGVKLAGLITTGQPAAKAGAHFRVIIAAGKFHGVIEATTPTGCFRTIMRLPSHGAGMVSP